MTSGAITDVSHPFIAVFLVDLRLVVFMAVVAGVLSKHVGMAGGNNPVLRVIPKR
jgi:hypothetical protein